MSIKKNCVKRKYFNSNLYPINVIICIDQRLAVKNSVVSCLTSIFDLSNPKWRPFLFRKTIQIMSWWLCQVEKSLKIWCSRVLKLSEAPPRLCKEMNASVDWHALVYIADSSVVISSLLDEGWYRHTEFKLHTFYFGTSEQIKLLQPVIQAAVFKFESKFEPLHLAISPEGHFRRQSKIFRAKSMAKLLRPRSGTAWAGLTGEHKHRAFPILLQSLRAVTGSLVENMLPLLLCRLSSRVNKDLMLCKFWAATSHFFFHAKWKFR